MRVPKSLIAAGAGTQPMCFAADGNGSDVYYAVKPGQVVTFSGWGKRVSGDGLARPVIEVTDSRKSNPTWWVTTPNNISKQRGHSLVAPTRLPLESHLFGSM